MPAFDTVVQGRPGKELCQAAWHDHKASKAFAPRDLGAQGNEDSIWVKCGKSERNHASVHTEYSSS